MKRVLFLAVLLLAAGCAASPPEDVCSGVRGEGLAPVGCMDSLLVDNRTAVVVMLDRVVESASFASGRASGPCELVVRGDFSEVICEFSQEPQERFVGNVSGSVFFDNASRPYVVRAVVSES